MNFNADYGRRLVNSGLEGARSGKEEFLGGRSLTPFLNDSAQHAALAAAVGTGIGLFGGLLANRQKPISRALAYGLVGGVIGFGAGFIWYGRRLGTSVVSGALRNIARERDEHWLEENPIDYA